MVCTFQKTGENGRGNQPGSSFTCRTFTGNLSQCHSGLSLPVRERTRKPQNNNVNISLFRLCTIPIVPSIGGVFMKKLISCILAIAVLLLVILVSGCTGSTAGSIPATPSVTPAPSIAVTSIPVQYADVNGVRIGYRQFGSGEPLLLICGFNGTMDNMWNGTFLGILASHTMCTSTITGGWGTAAIRTKRRQYPSTRTMRPP